MLNAPAEMNLQSLIMRPIGFVPALYTAPLSPTLATLAVVFFNRCHSSNTCEPHISGETNVLSSWQTSVESNMKVLKKQLNTLSEKARNHAQMLFWELFNDIPVLLSSTDALSK